MMLEASARVPLVSIALVQTLQEYLVLQGTIVQREETLTLLNAHEGPLTCTSVRRIARYAHSEEFAQLKA